MLVWTPEASGNETTRQLYELCRRMGAPQFYSVQEMQEWIRHHFDSLKSFYYNSLEPFIELLEGADRDIFGSLLEALREVQGRRVRAALLEQLKQNTIFKSLHTPLEVIPQSLRPIESVAH